VSFTETTNGSLLSDNIKGVFRGGLWIQFLEEIYNPKHFYPCFSKVDFKFTSEDTMFRTFTFEEMGRVETDIVSINEKAGSVTFLELDTDDNKERKITLQIHQQADIYSLEYSDSSGNNASTIPFLKEIISKARAVTTDPVYVSAEVSKDNTFLSEPITGVTREGMWRELVNKIRKVRLYLPVYDIEFKDFPEYVHRKMKIKFPTGEVSIKEEIVSNEEKGIVEFFVLDKEGKRTNEVKINVLHQDGDAFRLEYYNLDTSTNTKTPLKGLSAYQITTYFSRLRARLGTDIILY